MRHGCKDAFMCHISCPLWIAREVESLMNNKQMTLGEAYKATLRMQIENAVKRKLLRNSMLKDKGYPEGAITEVWRRVSGAVQNAINEVMNEQSNSQKRRVVNHDGVADRAGDKPTKERYGHKSIEIRGVAKDDKRP